MGELRRTLVRLVRLLQDSKPGGHLLARSPARTSLRLELPLDPASPRRDREHDERLLRELHRLLDEEIEQLASFRPGRIFCHRCGGPECGHALPPDPRSVFLGWTATGRPRWADFAQLCLDRHHPRVDLLYEEPPDVLYLVMDQDDLSLDLLPPLRRERRTEVLAQVALGFFPTRPREPRRDLRALTAQAIGSRPRRGPYRLSLNLICGEPDDGRVARMWSRNGSPWSIAARTAQGKLQTLALKARRARRSRRPSAGWAPDDPRDFLRRGSTAILAEFARRVARETRGRARRTRHAEERHTSGQRPTRTALHDLRRSTPADLMVDRRTGVLVVHGERGRTHFFNPDGRLVSSVRYAQDEVSRKRKRGHWRPATSEEARRLLDTLK